MTLSPFEGNALSNLASALTPALVAIGSDATLRGLTITGEDALTLTGDGTVWEDLRVPITATRLGGTKDPGFSVFKTNGSGSQGVFLYWFDATSEEELYFVVQLPHTWKEASTIYPHVHWTPAANGGAGEFVRWGLEYTFSDIDEDFGNTSIIYSDASTAATATTKGDASLVGGRHYKTNINGTTGITAGSKTISCMLVCRIFRDATTGTDDYTGDAGLLEVDFHYEIDSLGSQSADEKVIGATPSTAGEAIGLLLALTKAA